MSIITWWRRHFTVAGQDAAWRERYLQRHGEAYAGHVPPQPMPAPAPESKMWGPNVNPDPPPQPVAPMISLTERAERFQLAMRVVHQLSPASLAMLAEDGRILAHSAAWAVAVLKRPRHHGMNITARKPIRLGKFICLTPRGDGRYFAEEWIGDE